MQIRDLIDALKRFDEHEEVTIELNMPPDPANGRCGQWIEQLRIEDVRRDRMTPVLTVK